jgi:hypothetical protein
MMSGQDFKLIKEDILDKKLTAENVIGKKVVDRDGKTVGKVKDIGLQAAFQETSGSTYASSTTSGSSSSTTSRSIPSSTTTSPTPSSTGAGAMTGRPSGMQSQQVSLYVELDNDLGLEGDDLAAIPASSVQFDSTKKELRLQIASSELKSKLQQSSTSQSGSFRRSTDN